MRHHYVPQFLLRRWTDASGKLRAYAIRGNRLTVRADTQQWPAVELITRLNRASLASSSQRIWGMIDAEGTTFVETNKDLIGIDMVPIRALAPWNRDT